MKISLCMIVKDEENFLGNCLNSIHEYVDEIIIVDTGSKDKTKDIAMKFTENVYDYIWCDDFATARNFSISKASNDWILVLDADEMVTSFDAVKVKEFMKDDNLKVGRIKITNIIDSQQTNIKSTEWVSRFFNKKEFYYEGVIHEQITHKSKKQYKVGKIGINVEHLGYKKEIIEIKCKIQRNKDLLMKEIVKNPNDLYLCYQLGKTYYLAGEYDIACDVFDKALELCDSFKYPYVEDLIVSYGYSLVNCERYNEALELEAYNKYFEESSDYNFIMGLIYMNNAKFDKAIERFKSCIGNKEGRIDGVNSYLPNYNIAIIYEVSGDIDIAQKYYSRCGKYKLAEDRLKEININNKEKIGDSRINSLENRKKIVLTPSYMKSFKCIGAECEDSCCVGWKVTLDKETYLKYKKIQDKDLRPIFNKMIGRQRSQSDFSSYGRIKMMKDGRCPFLNENNLCKIHGKLGEEYLSDTCALYPRHVNKIDGKLERAAVMSCPEIARLALLDVRGIYFEQIEEYSDRIKIHKVFDTEGHLYINKPERYFWDIRIFSLSLLQNRNYSLGERLILLGIAYERIEEVSKSNKTSEIPLVLESINNMIDAGLLKEELDNVPTNIQTQIILIQKMINQKLIQGIQNNRYKECIEETLEGIGFIGQEVDEKSESIIKRYEENYRKYLVPYLEEKEYILENYLVNEYFKELMPFGKYQSIWDSYIFLSVLYSMLKLHMIGMSGYHKGMTDELVLKLIQSFSKIVLHNDQYIYELIKAIKDKGYGNLAYMTILVKN
ncbi:flagellin lysine-N-methylase [Tissierella pigra]|uniref:flagellin lysine-N-methylase n=1 Tax=Tissierella pigra TaxID=2607614 RepID=UPI001C10B8FA|nr:flagellin lysine-N-methylase [Tissierella pigra]MBU5427804.1 flagellin lysine-N-methylase [Tissierella pigra]